MLPAPLRMRRSEDFAQTIRRGTRAGRDTLVVHCRLVEGGAERRVGLVVAKTVGNAVVRNRVRRRLRAVVVEQVDVVPPGTDLVLRALPPAHRASYSVLRDEYVGALSSAVRRASSRARA
ncbi:ribonuclease P protein component [Actinotalea sp. BY-33]|uniref:Ribonuclease P protein component n=1 Tax=Actinotalea soli TaxID=2819234 RepID=A0A939LPC4_9CELL|nr:ribonuclease P protein component [Actinotalea soli]MBO1751173.1 ribonuclease P protein component [Actinotalea soli]